MVHFDADLGGTTALDIGVDSTLDFGPPDLGDLIPDLGTPIPDLGEDPDLEVLADSTIPDQEIPTAECQTPNDCAPGDSCLNEQCVSNGPEPAEEICGDGIDNNGDGVVDENCNPAGSDCQVNDDCGPSAGCLNGQCVGNAPEPAEEICGDGIDNNRNDVIDENCQCMNNLDCPQRQQCVNGLCTPPGG